MKQKFQRVLENLDTVWIKRVLIIFIAFSVFVFSVRYWLVSKATESSLIEQTLLRQQVVARAGAKSIENFVQFFASILKFTASRPSLVSGGEVRQSALDSLIEQFAGTPIVGTVLTDAEGVVIYNSNQAGIKDTGESVADREYFDWARKAGEGEVYVGSVVVSKVGQTKGQGIFPVAIPVIRDQEFRGVLVVAILISDLVKEYLDPLKISGDSYAHLFDSEGVWLVSTKYPELVGTNYLDFIRKNPYRGSASFAQEVRQIINDPREARFVTNSVDPKGLRLLVAVSPIKITGEKIKGPQPYWFLSVAMPLDETMMFFEPFNKRQAAALILFIFVALTVSAIAILGIYIAQRDSFTRGFVAGRDHKGKNPKH